MSSLAERLRVRSDKKPMYNYDESDDDFVVPKGKREGKEGKADEKAKRFVRDDAKEDACQICAEGGSLMSCVTCTYSYHLKCVLPPSRATPGDGWSCPECVSPLNEIDKILDCEMRPAKPGTQPKFDKQYLVKWKGLSYLHCTWVPEKDFVKASKSIPRLKTRLNNFYKQMDSMNNSEDETVAIRPEWTTVDRILASR